VRQRYYSPERVLSNIHRKVKPSEFGFRPLSELKKGTKVFLLCRVSTGPQEKRTLNDQEKKMRHELEKLGCPVVDFYRYEGSGKIPEIDIDPAVEMALLLDAVFVAESMCRLGRPFGFYPNAMNKAFNPNAVYREHDLRLLCHQTRGVPVYVSQHPDASPGEVRSAQTKRGRDAKDVRGGRPPATRAAFKIKWQPVVLKLRDEGNGLRTIAKLVSTKSLREGGKGMTFTTVRNWTK
jgi:hypothetical protein